MAITTERATAYISSEAPLASGAEAVSALSQGNPAPWATDLIQAGAQNTRLAPGAFASRENQYGDVAFAGALLPLLGGGLTAFEGTALGAALLKLTGLNLSIPGLGSSELNIDDPSIGEWARPLPPTTSVSAKPAPVTVNSMVSAMQAAGLSPAVATYLKSELAQLQAQSLDNAAFATNLRTSPQLMSLALARATLQAAKLPSSPLALNFIIAQMQIGASDPQQAIAFANKLATSRKDRNSFATQVYKSGFSAYVQQLRLLDPKIAGQFSNELTQRARGEGVLPYQYLTHLMQSGARALNNPQSALFTALATATARAYGLPVQNVVAFMQKQGSANIMSSLNALANSPQVLAAVRGLGRQAARARDAAARARDAAASLIPGRQGKAAKERQSNRADAEQRQRHTEAWNQRQQSVARDVNIPAIGTTTAGGGAPNPSQAPGGSPPPDGNITGKVIGGGIAFALASKGVELLFNNIGALWQAQNTSKVVDTNTAEFNRATATLTMNNLPKAPPEFRVLLKDNQLYFPPTPTLRSIYLAAYRNGEISERPETNQEKEFVDQLLKDKAWLQSGDLSGRNVADIVPVANKILQQTGMGLRAHKDYQPPGTRSVSFDNFFNSPLGKSLLTTIGKPEVLRLISSHYDHYQGLKFKEIEIKSTMISLYNQLAGEMRSELAKVLREAIPDFNPGQQSNWMGNVEQATVRDTVRIAKEDIQSRYNALFEAASDANVVSRLPREPELVGGVENIEADITQQKRYVDELQATVRTYRGTDPGLAKAALEKLTEANTALQRLQSDQRQGASAQSDRDQTDIANALRDWNDAAKASYGPAASSRFEILIGNKLFTIPYRTPGAGESTEATAQIDQAHIRAQAAMLHEIFSKHAGKNGLPRPFPSTDSIVADINEKIGARRNAASASANSSPTSVEQLPSAPPVTGGDDQSAP